MGRCACDAWEMQGCGVEADYDVCGCLWDVWVLGVCGGRYGVRSGRVGRVWYGEGACVVSQSLCGVVGAGRGCDVAYGGMSGMC